MIWYVCCHFTFVSHRLSFSVFTLIRSPHRTARHMFFQHSNSSFYSVVFVAGICQRFWWCWRRFGLCKKCHFRFPTSSSHASSAAAIAASVIHSFFSAPCSASAHQRQSSSRPSSMSLSQYHVKYCPYHAFVFQMTLDAACCFSRWMQPQCSHLDRFNILVAGSHIASGCRPHQRR